MCSYQPNGTNTKQAAAAGGAPKIAVGQMTAVNDQEQNLQTCRRLAEVGGRSRSTLSPGSFSRVPCACEPGRLVSARGWIMLEPFPYHSQYTASAVHLPCLHLIKLYATTHQGAYLNYLLDHSLQSAVVAGCSMLFLPENFSFMGSSQAEVCLWDAHLACS